MIPVHAYEGRRVAVFGLGRTGIATAKALAAGGALVSCWDDSGPARERALAAGIELDDLNRRDWGDIAALVLSPGIPLTHPKPHHMVERAHAVGAPVIGDTELFAMALAGLPERRRPKVIGITGTNGKSTTTPSSGISCGKPAARRLSAAISAMRSSPRTRPARACTMCSNSPPTRST